MASIRQMIGQEFSIMKVIRPLFRTRAVLLWLRTQQLETSIVRISFGRVACHAWITSSRRALCWSPRELWPSPSFSSSALFVRSCWLKRSAVQNRSVKLAAGSCSRASAYSPTHSRSRSKWRRTPAADNTTPTLNTLKWTTTPTPTPTRTYPAVQVSCKLTFTAFLLLMEPPTDIKQTNNITSVM